MAKIDEIDGVLQKEPLRKSRVIRAGLWLYEIHATGVDVVEWSSRNPPPHFGSRWVLVLAEHQPRRFFLQENGRGSVSAVEIE